ncbi:hypothetical protein [Planctomycetes bacterium Poly30]|uniref:hypothetical protein n=1 Tax=Saltatorellus ferox TaxID=2528018 RepID=UPI0011A1C492
MSLSLAAQQEPMEPTVARGKFSAWPFALVERGDNVVRLKGPGDQPATSPPQAWQSPFTLTATDPIYSTGVLFPGSNPPTIDAMSTGNDVIPAANSVGTPAVGLANFNWLALAVTVKNGGTGKNPSILWQEQGKYGSRTGASVLSYYFDGSIGINPRLVDKTVLEASRNHLGYASTSSNDINAMDYGIGLMTCNEGPNLDPLIYTTNEFFFSVTREWANSNSTVAFARHPGTTAAPSLPPHAGTIYRLEWNENATATAGAWSAPEEFVPASDLFWNGYVEESVNDFDVDMLAVCPLTNTIIYSTSRETLGAPSQLMIYTIGGPNPPV